MPRPILDLRCFPSVSTATANTRGRKYRGLDNGELDTLVPAYAATVHKSQGLRRS